MTIQSTLPRLQWMRVWTWLTFSHPGILIILCLVSVFQVWIIISSALLPLINVALLVLFPVFIFIWCIVRPALSSKSIETFAPRQHIFTEEGFTEISIVGHKLIRWDAVKYWRSIGSCYAIFMKAGTICVIPKSAVPQNLVPTLESLLHKHIKQ